MAAFFSATTGYSPENAFVRPVGIDAGARATGTVYESETGELTYDAPRHRYLIHAAGAAGIIGFPGSATAWTLERVVYPLDGAVEAVEGVQHAVRDWRQARGNRSLTVAAL